MMMMMMMMMVVVVVVVFCIWHLGSSLHETDTQATDVNFSSKFLVSHFT
jgi:uncharacterized membrane protein YqjE